MQTSPYTTNPFFSNISEAFKTVSEWPGKVIEFGEEQNRAIVDFMQNLQGAAGSAEDPLKRTELRRTGGDVIEWLSENQSMVLLIGAAIIAFFMFKK